MKKLRPIMFVGTGSDVGKSIIVTGICRLLKQKGYSPAPFKAQNMSLNSFVTTDGLEIGRAQAVQAEACKIESSTDMNPILLKPSGANKSQVVLHGKPIGDQTIKEYFLGNNKMHLFEEAKAAFTRLQQSYNPIVLEGAGSISELNLKHRDIVNMRMAKAAEANVFLIADIDKGGVFASIYGSIALLEPWEKELIKGIIINKFRGDISLFEEGKSMLKKLTGIPVLGIIPYAKDIYIEEEDSVALQKKQQTIAIGQINIAVVLLPYISNYTDFNVLEKDPRTHLFYSNDPKDIAKADIIILPGSKNTIQDLIFLREKGIAKVILEANELQKPIIGICGGYQMLGKTIKDPLGVESDIKAIPGLGIFSIHTILTSEKTTTQCSFTYKNSPKKLMGYEIHMGQTIGQDCKPLNYISNNPEGSIQGNCWGTYIHGILDHNEVIEDLLHDFTNKKTFFNYKAYKEENYDKLANLLEENMDIDSIIAEMHTIL
ncbi:cobyric acid synthase [Aquimarina muelleri]|uniref:Cobyric acid synthase n=1 Tax=Aquimarina muelleri TaxID=279356 RepID=A0A918JT31_9FLAO|nr:cobyric acid synthase [Aquimarina muelleri]MCX2762668.1 cobyric acid synthase [Aquimarina muelleri]GGX05629.1 cobyric acid synthase [Aquimarina muelleri]